MGTATADWCSRRALIATMHAKERVIAPLLARFLGIEAAPVAGLDTDAFGTFSRDVARAGSQLDAARAKIAAAFALDPSADLAVASEGSIGPHPWLPMLALDREIVLLADPTRGLELIGQYATTHSNFAHAAVTSVADGLAFAARIGFPGHGVIVMGCRDGAPAPDLLLVKMIDDDAALGKALADATALTGTAWIEADMRAHRNPRRMRAIGRATIDLVRRAASRCPDCARPGYAPAERLPGLPCRWCGTPTGLVRATLIRCEGCGRQEERAVAAADADPAYCPECNP